MKYIDSFLRYDFTSGVDYFLFVGVNCVFV